MNPHEQAKALDQTLRPVSCTVADLLAGRFGRGVHVNVEGSANRRVAELLGDESGVDGTTR